MFSLSQRFQDITGFMSSTVLVMAAIISVISIIQLNINQYDNLQGQLKIRNTHNHVRYSRNYGGSYNKGKENLRMRFDLDADLRPLFNWDTKQVIAYVVGEYQNTRNTGNSKGEPSSSKVVFWDRIISDADHAKLHLRNKKSKYSIYDYYSSFGNNSMKMSLEFNVQPWVGPLTWGSVNATDTMLVEKPKKSSK